MDDKFFSGSKYSQALKEFDWFEHSPDKISPLEIVEWAISIGQWEMVDTSDSCLYWKGPWGNPPFPGCERAVYKNRDMALSAMRDQYSNWWDQKILLRTAFAALHERTQNLMHTPESEDEDEE